MRDAILLDTCSSVDLFCKRELLQDVHETNVPLRIATNAGETVVNQRGTLPGYGSVWFDPNAMTNVFSFGNMTDRHDIEYSHEERSFRVKTPMYTYKFSRSGDDNIYKLVHRQRTGVQLASSVKENSSFYTKQQVDRARKVRDMIRSLGCPSLADMRAAIKMNCIRNQPFTEDDITVAEKIFGPDVATVKGKTTRRKSKPYVRDVVSIPPELIQAQRNVHLCMDTMFVNGMPFLTTISKNIYYRTATFVTARTVAAYQLQVREVLQVYARAGFRVTEISADREYLPVLNPLMDEFGFRANYASAQEHVPPAERNNRTIKERVRASYHGSPFRCLPRIAICYMVMEAAAKLNYFPAKYGCSKVYSPRMILHHTTLDYVKHCKIPILSYVLAHDEPVFTNTVRARALDCLYLRALPNNNAGGHEMYHIPTRRVISRAHATVVPAPQSILDAVNAIGKSEGIKDLKIETREQSRLGLLSSSLAGVDDTVDPPNDDDDDDDDDASSAGVLSLIDDFDESDDEEQDEDDPNDIYADAKEEQQASQKDPSESDSDNSSDNPDPEDDGLPEMGTPLPTIRRSVRTRQEPARLEPTMTGKSHIVAPQQANPFAEFEYTSEEARVLATIMTVFNERMDMTEIKEGHLFVQQYSLKAGLKKFGERGKKSAHKELGQLHDRECFRPIHKSSLNSSEMERALESLIFMIEKRDGTIKTRHCANGSTQRAYMDRDEVTSPTVSTEATLLTAVIDAYERRDVATCDIPNAFVQTTLPQLDKRGNRTIMKIRGACVDILCEIDPFYKDYVVLEGKHQQKVLYVELTKAIYGLLVSAMLFYRKLVTALTGYGFKLNPYDPCVANKMVEGSQLTICWHVDDVKSSHINPKVNDDFLAWVKKEFGQLGEVKTTRGKVHDYLGMVLDYRIDGQVGVDMTRYVKSMVTEFPSEWLKGPVASPWNDNLFQVKEDSPELDSELAKKFHTVTAQGLFLCKRGRPDIAPAIAYLTTRVRKPNKDDWGKLCRLMQFLKQTQDDVLTLSADDTKVHHWHVDASFAVHPDFKSHTGGTFSMGKGAITSISRKQGLNTRSSTEAEVVGADDAVGPMVWTRRFMEEQGYPPERSILYQDNKSAILLETNGRASAGKRSRHLNIRYFYVADQRDKGLIEIIYCPTDQMTGDYMTKPLHGAKFADFRQQIMNLPVAAQLMMAAVLC